MHRAGTCPGRTPGQGKFASTNKLAACRNMKTAGRWLSDHQGSLPIETRNEEFNRESAPSRWVNGSIPCTRWQGTANR